MELKQAITEVLIEHFVGKFDLRIKGIEQRDAFLNATQGLLELFNENSPSEALVLIADERKRQIEVEGWTYEHDDKQTYGELASAASCYALNPNNRPPLNPPVFWPFKSFWKPTPNNRIHELTKSGALIVAEIERLQRKEKKDGSGNESI